MESSVTPPASHRDSSARTAARDNATIGQRTWCDAEITNLSSLLLLPTLCSHCCLTAGPEKTEDGQHELGQQCQPRQWQGFRFVWLHSLQSGRTSTNFLMKQYPRLYIFMRSSLRQRLETVEQICLTIRYSEINSWDYIVCHKILEQHVSGGLRLRESLDNIISSSPQGTRQTLSKKLKEFEFQQLNIVPRRLLMLVM